MGVESIGSPVVVTQSKGSSRACGVKVRKGDSDMTSNSQDGRVALELIPGFLIRARCELEGEGRGVEADRGAEGASL